MLLVIFFLNPASSVCVIFRGGGVAVRFVPFLYCLHNTSVVEYVILSVAGPCFHYAEHLPTGWHAAPSSCFSSAFPQTSSIIATVMGHKVFYSNSTCSPASGCPFCHPCGRAVVSCSYHMASQILFLYFKVCNDISNASLLHDPGCSFRVLKCYSYHYWLMEPWADFSLLSSCLVSCHFPLLASYPAARIGGIPYL